MKASEIQDEAAGGRKKRTVKFRDGGTARASIELKNFRGHQTYAYLRYTLNGKTVSKYVGKVTSNSRSGSLSLAWHLVRKKRLLAPD